MEKQIVIAYAVKNEEELKKIKRIVKEKFPGCTVVAFNYREVTERGIKLIVQNADAVVVSGFGRLIVENGVSVITTARKNRKPVYFIMSLSHDGLENFQDRLWAYRRMDSIYLQKPVITELTKKDENCTRFCGKQAIILPTYAM